MSSPRSRTQRTARPCLTEKKARDVDATWVSSRVYGTPCDGLNGMHTHDRAELLSEPRLCPSQVHTAGQGAMAGMHCLWEAGSGVLHSIALGVFPPCQQPPTEAKRPKTSSQWRCSRRGQAWNQGLFVSRDKGPDYTRSTEREPLGGPAQSEFLWK